MGKVKGVLYRPLIEHFFSNNRNGSNNDIKVQIIDYCDPNQPERRKYFWICLRDTTFAGGLNTRKLVLWKLLL